MNDDNDLNLDHDTLAPTWRATIRGERLKLTTWAPWLKPGPATKSLFKARARAGVAIADISIAGSEDDEVIVKFHTPGRDRDGAEDILVGWAERVGYQRIWLSERIVDLEPAPDAIGPADVRCPTCGARWQDDSPDFWLMVRDAGQFPPWCLLCGNELPQWRSKRLGKPRPVERSSDGGRWRHKQDEDDE